MINELIINNNDFCLYFICVSDFHKTPKYKLPKLELGFGVFTNIYYFHNNF